MNNVDAVRARALAEAKVYGMGNAMGEVFAISHASTQTVDKGWVFFYNTEEFLKTGNPLSALAGNGPLLVLRNGQVKVLPTSLPWQEAVQNIDASTDGCAV